MRRRLFIIASGLSLLLCVASVVLWVRSRSFVDCIEYGNADTYLFFCSEHGFLFMGLDRGTGVRCGWRYRRLGFDYAGKPAGGESVYLTTLHPVVLWNVLSYDSKRHWIADVRLAWPTGAFVGLPMIYGAVILLRQINSSCRPTLCRVCGYDLRASPDRCPECGTAVPKKGAAPSPS